MSALFICKPIYLAGYISCRIYISCRKQCIFDYRKSGKYRGKAQRGKIEIAVIIFPSRENHALWLFACIHCQSFFSQAYIHVISHRLGACIYRHPFFSLLAWKYPMNVCYDMMFCFETWFFKNNLFWWSLCDRKVTILKWAVQWYLVCSQCCTIYFQNISILWSKIPYH